MKIYFHTYGNLRRHVCRFTPARAPVMARDRKNARRDVPGAKAVYDELKKRYPGRKQSKPEDPE
jgi:hypothetical protein